MNKIRRTKILQIIIIGLVIISLFRRLAINGDDSVCYYMSFINAVSLYFSLIMMLLKTSDKMVAACKKDFEKSKKKNKNIKKSGNSSITYFNVLIIVMSVALVCVIYHISDKFSSDLLNDIYTILSLGIALSNDLLSDILYSLVYRYKE